MTLNTVSGPVWRGKVNFAVARSDLPEDLAYFVHNGFLPFHDGATRWYRDTSDVIMGD